MKKKRKSTNHVNIQNCVEKKPINRGLMKMQSDKQQKNINKGRESKEKYTVYMKKICNNNNRIGEWQ
jgi:hypothetical protein